MDKVEELREKVLGNYPKIATNEKGVPRIIDIIETVDSLISVVQEREKARILKWVETDAEMCDGGYGLLYTAVVSYLSTKEADNA